jgi:mRNA interferase MazF
MGAFTSSQVILFPFPYSDLSRQKLRPALLLADVDRGDWILCQITSNAYSDKNAIMLADSDFIEGGLQRISYVRANKLFTVHESIFQRSVGVINQHCYAKVVKTLVDLLKTQSSNHVSSL